MKQAEPAFPPLLCGHDVRGRNLALHTAVTGAVDGSLGAGDVVWARRTDALEIAIVLEPEVALRFAMQMVLLAIVAMGDCIGALTPPKVAVTFDWPGGLIVNGGRVGQISAVVPDDAVADAVPAWLALEAVVRLRNNSDGEPGERPDETALEEEGCPDLTRTAFIESYSRHFLTWINTWNDDGFRAVHDAWTLRAVERDGEMSVALRDGRVRKGAFVGLDEDGNLLLKDADGVAAVLLGDAVARPAREVLAT